MGESPEIELVRRTWEALIQGAPEVLGEVLAPGEQNGRHANLVPSAHKWPTRKSTYRPQVAARHELFGLVSCLVA
jgi:hypothetical protein